MIRNLYWIMDENGIPRVEHDLLKWAQWNDTHDRTIAKTKVGDALVSTVFLGIDHSHSLRGSPLLFETMVFGIEQDYMRRYHTREDAVAGHLEIVGLVEKDLPPDDSWD